MPTAVPSRRSGTTSVVQVPELPSHGAAPRGTPPPRSEDRARERPAARARRAPRRSPDRDQAAHGAGKRAVVSGHLQACPVQVENFCVVGSAEARGALDHRVQHRLDIRRRGADYPQDLGRRGLLLQGLGEVGVPSLQLGEQPRVLDGDHGLVGEGGDEVDLLVGERADLRPAHEEQSDQIVLPQHGDGQHGAVAADPLRLWYSHSGSARASMMWTVRRSRAARPIAEPRPGRITFRRQYSLNSGLAPYSARNRNTSPSNRARSPPSARPAGWRSR